LSHKLEVGERRSLASHYTLTTEYRYLTVYTYLITRISPSCKTDAVQAVTGWNAKLHCTAAINSSAV